MHVYVGLLHHSKITKQCAVVALLEAVLFNKEDLCVILDEFEPVYASTRIKVSNTCPLAPFSYDTTTMTIRGKKHAINGKNDDIVDEHSRNRGGVVFDQYGFVTPCSHPRPCKMFCAESRGPQIYTWGLCIVDRDDGYFGLATTAAFNDGCTKGAVA